MRGTDEGSGQRTLQGQVASPRRQCDPCCPKPELFTDSLVKEILKLSIEYLGNGAISSGLGAPLIVHLKSPLFDVNIDSFSQSNV